MIPVFGLVDPERLFNGLEGFDHIVCLLYDREQNQEFRDEFRRTWRKLQADTGRDVGIVVFDDPHEKWVKDNLDYFIDMYRDLSEDQVWQDVFSIIKEDNTDVNRYIREFLLDGYISYFEPFIRLFGLRTNDLPAVICFDGSQAFTYRLRRRIPTAKLDEIIQSLIRNQYSNRDRYRYRDYEQYNFPDFNIRNIFEVLSQTHSEIYWDILDSIACEQAKKENLIENNNIRNTVGFDEICNEYPAFSVLERPDAFVWHRKLIPCLRKYRSLLDNIVNRINLLHSNPHLRGLNIRQIHNFSRFKVNDTLRGHFYDINGRKALYYIGEHDHYRRERRRN